MRISTVAAFALAISVTMVTAIPMKKEENTEVDRSGPARSDEAAIWQTRLLIFESVMGAVLKMVNVQRALIVVVGWCAFTRLNHGKEAGVVNSNKEESTLTHCSCLYFSLAAFTLQGNYKT